MPRVISYGSGGLGGSGPVICQGGFFGQFWLKKAPSAHTWTLKMAKTPNIKKMGPIVVVSTLRNIYTKN